MGTKPPEEDVTRYWTGNPAPRAKETAIFCVACGNTIKGATFWDDQAKARGPYCGGCFGKPVKKPPVSLDKYMRRGEHHE